MMPLSPLAAKVRNWLMNEQLAAQKLVVAVSGGPDSVCLAHILWTWARESAFPALCLAHFNHGWRGAESDADQAFVESLYTGWRVQCPTLELRLGNSKSSSPVPLESGNRENAAREMRYAWLAEVARRQDFPCVLTGHTADDQAETVVHRMLRGSGLKGLRGIAPRRTLESGVELARPLLEATRAEVLDYLNIVAQGFRVDSSNQDLQFTRNRIRHELLPLLARDYNPGVVAVLGRLAQQAREIFEELERQTEEHRSRLELPRAGKTIVLDRRRCRETSSYFIREMLRLIWTRENWPLDAVGFDGWNQAAQVVLGERSAVQLPGGITLRLQERVVQIQPPF